MAEGGGITGLMALFSDTDSLEVPDFQRNYSWGEEQIDEFHKDVVFATRKNLDHFMGSVILMLVDSNPLFANCHSSRIATDQAHLNQLA
jgi:hypothetical protein